MCYFLAFILLRLFVLLVSNYVPAPENGVMLWSTYYLNVRQRYVMRHITLVFVMLFLALTKSHMVQANAFSLVSSDGGTLYLQSSVHYQKQARYLIDTGSSLTVLNRETFEALKAKQSVKESGVIIAKLANGSKQKVKLYTIPLLSLSDECHFENVSVAVMKNQHNILGMEVLSRAAPFGIQMSPPQITLSQCDVSTIPVVARKHTVSNHS